MVAVAVKGAMRHALVVEVWEHGLPFSQQDVDLVTLSLHCHVGRLSQLFWPREEAGAFQ